MEIKREEYEQASNVSLLLDKSWLEDWLTLYEHREVLGLKDHAAKVKEHKERLSIINEVLSKRT